jgi:hypothetical protein
LGVKRRNIELGLQVMLRAGLVEIQPANDGISYRASDGAANFLALLESDYASQLDRVAEWVITTINDLQEDDDFRIYMANAVGHWPAELSDHISSGPSPEGLSL